MSIDAEKYLKNPFLKGEDLEEAERTVYTIAGAEEVTMPDGKEVPVLSFMEGDQKLTLNKTRLRKLTELYGMDSDEWIGRKIALYAVPTMFNGKTVTSVAIMAAGKKKQGADEDVVFEQPPRPKRPVAIPVEKADDNTPF